MGHLDHYKDHHNLASLALITSCLRTRKEEEEKRSKRKSSKNTIKLSLLVTDCFEWNWYLERFWFNLIVSCIECTSSCIECVGWKLGCLEVWWLGGIYSPNHQSGCWGRLMSKGAPDSPVRQPRHPTVRVRPLELLTAGPPDRSCSLSGAPSGVCSDIYARSHAL
jgi:hypothetical protein